MPKIGSAERFHFSDHNYRSIQQRCNDKINLVSPTEFDENPMLAPNEIQAAALVVQHSMLNLGFDLTNLVSSEVNSLTEALRKLEQLQMAAQLLYSEWLLKREQKNKNSEFAIARLFNSMTSSARKIHTDLGIESPFDQSHITNLAHLLSKVLEHSLETGGLDIETIAKAAHITGNHRTHDLAWPWTVLPTFPKQHYGRILLSKVPGFDQNYPGFITQTTFLAGEITQFHTHGQNIAFARPLGNGEYRENAHINTTWQTASNSEVFPLRQTDRQFYTSGDVAVIPPLSIHGISGARSTESDSCIALDDLERNSIDIYSYTKNIRFGETSCLHIYMPDVESLGRAQESPFVKEYPSFFIENDMFVFDHQSKVIWAGGGGAWAKRLLSYGRSGEHCGACFTENDPRLEYLSEEDVLNWHLDHQVNQPIIFSS